MTPSPNRARLSVDLGGPWKLYTAALPRGMRAIGTVTRGAETGALMLVEATGLYVQLNASVSRSLDQRKVQAALDAARAGQHGGPGRGQGRKPEHGAEALVRCLVSLDADSIETLRQHGEGNLSRGIRMAADEVRKQ